MAVFQTMGVATRDRIEVRGFDLCGELIGHVGLTEMFHLEVRGRLPTPTERAVLDSVLVALAEHGLTPIALAARLTDLGSPGALQGAVAAGLLGAGDRFLGALDGCARLLQEWPDTDEDGDREHARALVAAARAEGRRMPGIGHPTHVDGDPRVPALYAAARAAGLTGLAQARLEHVRAAAEAAAGRRLPVNVDGAAAVLLTELGYPWQTARGVAVVARAAGLVGHLFDELRHPIAMQVWESAEEVAPYRPPLPEAD
jgi:citrate synthase